MRHKAAASRRPPTHIITPRRRRSRRAPRSLAAPTFGRRRHPPPPPSRSVAAAIETVVSFGSTTRSNTRQAPHRRWPAAAAASASAPAPTVERRSPSMPTTPSSTTTTSSRARAHRSSSDTTCSGESPAESRAQPPVCICFMLLRVLQPRSLRSQRRRSSPLYSCSPPCIRTFAGLLARLCSAASIHQRLRTSAAASTISRYSKQKKKTLHLFLASTRTRISRTPLQYVIIKSQSNRIVLFLLLVDQIKQNFYRSRACVERLASCRRLRVSSQRGGRRNLFFFFR